MCERTRLEDVGLRELVKVRRVVDAFDLDRDGRRSLPADDQPVKFIKNDRDNMIQIIHDVSTQIPIQLLWPHCLVS